MYSLFSGSWPLRNRVWLLLSLLPVAVAKNGIKFTKQPSNITVIEHDNVSIPCCTNTSFLPSWRINDDEYSSTVGLPSHFFLNATHFIIPDIALSLSGTAVQCFFLQIVPNVGIVKVNSSLGIITVTSKSTFPVSTSVITATNTFTNDITSTEKWQSSTIHSSSSLLHVMPNTTNFRSATNPTKTSSLSVHMIIYQSSVPVEGFQVPDVLIEEKTMFLAVLSSSIGGVCLLLFIFIVGLSAGIILWRKKAHRRQVSNRPIAPTTNPAYETWRTVVQVQQCHQSTGTSLQNNLYENPAYAQLERIRTMRQ